MAYFTHIQLKCNWYNFITISKAFFAKRKTKKVEEQLRTFWPGKQFIFCDMGRTAFRIILDKMELAETEIIMPSYICDIFYPILEEFDIKPIFIDADRKTFNMNIEQIEEKITPQTKAIVVCHTYGAPLEMEKLKAIAQKHHLKIIEDIAHAIGQKYQGQYLGSLGEAAFASLYKQFPSLRGGLVVAPGNWQVELKKTHFNFRDLISLLNYFSFFSFLLKRLAQKAAPKFLRKEKHQQYGNLNRISFNLFANYLPNIETNLEKRKGIAQRLIKGLAEMGFTSQDSPDNAFTFLSALIPNNLKKNRDEFVQVMQKKGVFLTRIWHTPIVINPEVQKFYEIDLTNFPNTSLISQQVVNIPLQNHFTEKDWHKILKKIKAGLACNS